MRAKLHVQRSDKNAYDAIIIGAGIGGLVCGCYLARAGMKVLICEQHSKPGGYCTSFKRGKFTFDAAAHCFGGYRKDGITRKVFEDLEICRKLKIEKCNPSDTVITPDYKVSYWADLEQTIKDFQSSFPAEATSLKNFFYFLIKPDPHLFMHIRHWTFKDLLDKYFTDEKLKATLAAPLLGLGGLPPSLMSAFIGIKLFSEFLLDGGYHPVGGMQVLSDTLAERFTELGGELLLSCPVRKIKINKNTVKGVILEERGFVSSKYVISNCDARQTFLNLIGKKKLNEEFYSRFNKMIPSVSSFIAYLGMDQYFKTLPMIGTTLCFFPHYDLDKSFQAVKKGDMERYGGYMLYIYKEVPSVLAIIPAPYRNKEYWDNAKYDFLEAFIDRIERYTIPNLSDHIVYKDAATPHTLHRYTLNYKGASFGWAGMSSQLAVAGFKKSSFEGLYMAGHWTTQGLGISGVIYVGYDTAKVILRKKEIRF